MTSVRDFGALPDGSDCRATLQAAANATKSGVLEFPPGVYGLSGYVDFDSLDGLHISGEGATLKALDDAQTVTNDGDLMRISRSGGFTVSGLALDGNATKRGQVETTVSMRLRECQDFRLERLVFTDAVDDHLYFSNYSQGVEESACHNGAIKDCKMSHSYRNGISVVSGYLLLFENCEISYSLGTQPKAGIDIEGEQGTVHHIRVKSCNIHHCFKAVNVPGLLSPHHITLDGNHVHDCFYGFSFNDPTQADHQIVGNTLENLDSIGISLQGTRMTCRRNTLKNGGSIGIYAEGSGHKILENTLNNYGIPDFGGCIHTINGTGGTIIHRNVIRKTPRTRVWTAIQNHAADTIGTNTIGV